MGKRKEELRSDNFLVMPDITKKKKNEREKYLKKRIDDLFGNMHKWLENSEFSLEPIKIDIDSVKLPAAKIFFRNSLIASLKPTGLWGFGVNCQIKIETNEEGNFVFDIANESSNPEWELIYRNGKQKKLNEIIFKNFLRKIKKK
jgi:hypothetical protein